MDCSQEHEFLYQPNPVDTIPIDLFVSKKKPHNNGGRSVVRFTDSSDKLVFTVQRPPPASHFDPLHSQSASSPPLVKRILADSSGNPLISIAHNHKATWLGFRKDGGEVNDLMFRVERTMESLTRIEFEVFLNNGDVNSKKCDFKMRGSPFFRSCTIYTGNSVVAQTSLMYKLGMQKVLVPRNRFRLTIFPGYADYAFIVALTVIFFYGRKLWI